MFGTKCVIIRKVISLLNSTSSTVERMYLLNNPYQKCKNIFCQTNTAKKNPNSNPTNQRCWSLVFMTGIHDFGVTLAVHQMRQLSP